MKLGMICAFFARLIRSGRPIAWPVRQPAALKALPIEWTEMVCATHAKERLARGENLGP